MPAKSCSLAKYSVFLSVLLLTSLSASAIADEYDNDAQIQSAYVIVDIGTLGGNSSVASDLNNSGEVVGWSDTNSGVRHAFVYHNGAMTDLGTLIGGKNSRALAINDWGQVVGVSQINGLGPGFPQISQGFIWEQGAMQSIGALFCPCSYNVRYGQSTAVSINDMGEISGWSETVRGPWVVHAMLYQSGGLQDVGGGAGDWSISRAFDINDSGDMAGDFAQDAGNSTSYDRHATLWRNGNRIDLGTLPGDRSSTASAINDRDQIVGWSGTLDGTVSHAFRWENGYMQNLDLLPGDTNSAAEDINIYGQIVGWSGTARDTDSHAVLWTNHRIFDLNQLLPEGSGWVLTDASAINARGQIVGTGTYDGQVRAFVLEPAYRSWKHISH